MKTKHGSEFQARHVPMIAPGLVLVLLLNPFSYAVAQQSKSEGLSKASGVAAQPTKIANSQTVPTNHVAVPDNVPDDDNAPVPPMPPLDPAESAPPSPSNDPSSDLLPDSPGAVESAQLETQRAPVTQPSSQQSSAQPPAQQPPPAMPQEPLGTAAAETVPTVGIAASRPAGAALAPAKQRRVRMILIRMGAIVGAAAALGVTMALTEGSPSKPPGAH
ncbi:MAG: hypothetical protein WA609_19460 [Terriglobales bacterium]